MRRVIIVSLVLAGSCGLAAPTAPQNHPLIAPYRGSKIIESKTSQFDSIAFPLEAKQHGRTVALEGQIFRASYENPPQRSTLEILRNYQQALTQAGFRTEASFSGAAQIPSGHQLVGMLGLNQLTFCYDPPTDKTHYALLKKQVGDTATHVAVFVAPCKPDKTVLWVVESRAMDQGQVAVNSAALAAGLESEGHVALYGIQFPFDSAEITADAVPHLKEIAKLLREKPSLSLFVVGHTDQEGELKYNLPLSERRAQAVVQWLVQKEKVAGQRLSGHGVGPLAPVASNRIDAGRAKNRRVELIERIR